MRWPVFALLVYGLLALQIGLSDAASIDTAYGRLQPWTLLPLAVFVGMSTTPYIALAAWIICGLLLDMTTTWSTGLTLIGPNALGYLAGGYVLLQFRTMLIRRHPLALASMTLLCGIGVQLIVVAIMSFRGIYELQPDWTGSSQLLLRGLNLLYSAGLAFALAPIFNGLSPLMGFQNAAKIGPRGMAR